MSWEFEQYVNGTVTASQAYKMGVDGKTRLGSDFEPLLTPTTAHAVYDYEGGVWVKSARIFDPDEHIFSLGSWAKTISSSGDVIAMTYMDSRILGDYDAVRIYTRTGDNWDITAFSTALVYKSTWGGMWFGDNNTTLYTKSSYEGGYTIRQYNISGETLSLVTQYTYTTTTPLYKEAAAMIWSGRDVWGIRIDNDGYISYTVLNHWDATTDYERLTWNHYFENGVYALTPFYGNRIESFQPNITDPNQLSLTVWYNKIYALVGQHIVRFDIETRLPDGIITEVPQTAQSNICAAGGKLFVSGKELDSNESQKLHIYNIATNTWTSTVLPGRHQVTRRHIVDGLDSYVWVTNMNNHGIIKVNVSTGAIASTIRVNRHPYRLSVNQSKELYVASDFGAEVKRKDYNPDVASTTVSTSKGGQMTVAGSSYKVVETTDCTDGMITLINQSNDSQENFAAARCNGEAQMYNTATVDKDFFDDGQGHLWFISDTNIGRLTKSDKELKCSHQDVDSTSETEPDYNMIPDNGTISFSKSSIIASVVTPAVFFQRYVNDAFENRNVKPYLYVMTSTGSVTAYRLSALVRKNKYILRGTSLIAVGAQAYIGD